MNFTLFGVDRIEAGVWIGEYEERSANMRKQLAELQAAVRATRVPAHIDLGWRRFEVQPGVGKLRWYDYHLVHPQLHVWLCEHERQNVPPMRVAVLSETLWALTPQRAWESVLEMLVDLRLPYLRSTLSRFDICTDFDGHPLSHRDLVDIVCRGRYVGPYDPQSPDAITAFDARIWMQRRKGQLPLTGLQLGKSELICRLYNKQLEIVQASGKRWMYPLWVSAGWPGFRSRVVNEETGEAVWEPATEPWRCEFEIHREVLKQIAEERDAPAIDTVEDGLRLASALWRYLTTSWLRFVDKTTDEKPTRCRTRSWWQELQDPTGLPPGEPAMRVGNLLAAKLDVSARGALGYLANVAGITGKLTMEAALEELIRWARENDELDSWHEKAQTRRLQLGVPKRELTIGGN